MDLDKHLSIEPLSRDKFRQIEMSEVVSVTRTDTHHYFVVDLDFQPVRNQDGKIFVFTDRHRAGLIVPAGGGAVVGMGDQTWAEFQKEEKYIVIQ